MLGASWEQTLLSSESGGASRARLSAGKRCRAFGAASLSGSFSFLGVKSNN